MSKAPKINRRVLKQAHLRQIAELLAVRGYTTAELSEATKLPSYVLCRYYKEIGNDYQQLYVSEWVLGDDSRWKARRMFGVGVDAQRPPPIPGDVAGRLYRERVRADPERKKQRDANRRDYENHRREQKRALKELADAHEEKERIAKEREERERAAKAAKIQPHMDPWAHFFHGGIAMLAGVEA